ncbi:MAG: GIY-YIG nuclease family protein [Fimbriiglobus sp.]
MRTKSQDGDANAKTLFETDHFTGFGPSLFRPAGEVPLGKSLRIHGAGKLQAAVREKSPTEPGIYGMLDAKDRVIYIGKAKNLRSRLLSYFRKNSRHPKAGKIIYHTHRLVWEHTADELAALLRELELIRHFRPRFNVVGMPGPRRYIYLALGKTPAPYVYLTRNPTGKEMACYGPLVGRGRLKSVVRRLNDWFQLRDCPQTVPLMFADQPELFPEDRSPRCLRHELQNCLGPCVGSCSRAEYSAKSRAAKAFLDGRDRTPLTELTKRMRMASNQLLFEQAQALRDRLVPLTWIEDRLTFLRSARQQGSFVYPLAADDGRVMWYLIRHGEVQAVAREPQPGPQAEAMLKLLEQTAAIPNTTTEITYKTVDSVLLVYSWFRQHPEAREQLLTFEEAKNRVAELMK